jgi:hypothetical protein
LCIHFSFFVPSFLFYHNIKQYYVHIWHKELSSIDVLISSLLYLFSVL